MNPAGLHLLLEIFLINSIEFLLAMGRENISSCALSQFENLGLLS